MGGWVPTHPSRRRTLGGGGLPQKSGSLISQNFFGALCRNSYPGNGHGTPSRGGGGVVSSPLPPGEKVFRVKKKPDCNGTNYSSLHTEAILVACQKLAFLTKCFHTAIHGPKLQGVQGQNTTDSKYPPAEGGGPLQAHLQL